MNKTKILDMLPQRVHPAIKGLYHTIFPEKERDGADFSGGGMTLYGKTMPWEGIGGDRVSEGFTNANSGLKTKFKNNEFTLIRASDELEYIKNRRWRNYIMYWSAAYAANYSTEDKQMSLVECGVAEGVSAYFAMNAFEDNDREYNAYLYDSWDKMRGQELLESEMGKIGNYDVLDEDITQENLQEFSNSTIYIDGYIPEVFDTVKNPDSISWLHIDLNSAIPTQEVLQQFYKSVEKGGVILFDDYGWSGYTETKVVVDDFFGNHNSGIHFPLPTGQSIYFKQ
jgi:hypothetical protein